MTIQVKNGPSVIDGNGRRKRLVDILANRYGTRAGNYRRKRVLKRSIVDAVYLRCSLLDLIIDGRRILKVATTRSRQD